MNRGRTRLASVAAVALLSLAVLPMLAGGASAAPVSGASAGTGWAYGGQGSSNGTITLGRTTLSWNATTGVDVIYNATNTSATTTELTANRTVVVSVLATYSGPYANWTYRYQAAEDDHGYANLTNASATVTLSNGTTVAALGLLNASLLANVSVQASLVGSSGNHSVSDYLNVSGWGHAQVAFAPALGLVPLNLTGVAGWSSSATASGNAAWNVSWAFENHGWNGSSRSKAGDFNGTWSASTSVTLHGSVLGPSAVWTDHRSRTGIALTLAGPFDLYGGVLLIPHGFDVFSGAGAAYAGAGLGSSAVTGEHLYLSEGRLSITSFTAASLTTGASAPDVTGAGSLAPAGAGPSASSPAMTVYAQPESPHAAESQASCLQYGCSSGGSPLFGGFGFVVLVVGVVAAVGIVVVLARRQHGRGGRSADTPLAPTPSSPGAVTPPTGAGSNGPIPPTF